MNIKDLSFFCSWSGGKDSALAFYRAVKSGGIPKFLFTMFEENQLRSRSHNLPLVLLQEQAKQLNIPLILRGSSWGDYEMKFIEEISKEKEGLDVGIFGDIDLEAHREWEEKVCKKIGITPILPLWLENRRTLVEEFLDKGFKALIVCVNEDKMDKKYLGRILNKDLIDEFESIGIDVCGEEGEYHTFVFDGPIFNKPINYQILEEEKYLNYSMLKLGKYIAKNNS